MFKKKTFAACVYVIGLTGISSPSAAEPARDWTTSRIVPVEHITVHTQKDYDSIKTALEGRIGRLDEPTRKLLAERKLPELKSALERIAGNEGLVIHYVALHGDWLALNGGPRKGIVYHIGNVLLAVQMTKENFGAGLYAPLRLAVYATDDGGTTFEYDRPSTLFGQFHNPAIDEVAAGLDAKLGALVTSLSK
jgi:uncharacterized protein (DUF302 family)